jgi:hypothetical protein
VRAALDDLAAVEYEDLVGVPDRHRRCAIAIVVRFSASRSSASAEQGRLVNSLGRFAEVTEQQA